MDNKKIRINIQVGESRYPLWVDRSEEPIFREAARMVNRRLITYTTKYRGSGLTPDNYLAMAAVDLAVLCLRQQDNTDSVVNRAALASIVSDLKDFIGPDPDPQP